jgi:hypothetical protein
MYVATTRHAPGTFVTGIDDTSGWVAPEVLGKYGLEGNARDAWEKNGGGRYSHKNILGMAWSRAYSSGLATA